MTLTPADIKRVIERYHDGLLRHRETLNQLNVYPVPDGDTGTNMALTVTSVLDACAGAETMVEVAEAISHGSLMGARGNSGVILSQILRGLCDTFREHEGVDSAAFREALSRASDAAYESVVRPVEGTILTVVREAATGAREVSAAAADELGPLIERVYERALGALESTPDLLPVLKQAGVVDAGGAGLLLLIGAFVEETTGAAVDLPPAIAAAAAARGDVGAGVEPDVSKLRYEVMFFLETDDDEVAGFRSAWAEIGDSIVVVGGDGTYNCHIHTDDIGRSIESGIDVGRPYDIRITDLLEQAGATALHGENAGFEPLEEFARAPVGVVAVAAGPGLVDMFRTLGAQSVVGGGQSMNPSTEELLSAVEAVPAPTVVVLPNNKNIVPVANQLDALTEKRIEVVATRSVPEGIAAMVAYQPAATSDAVVAAMSEAAQDVTSGEVTWAVRDSVTDIGDVKEGEWLVIVRGDIVASAASAGDALVALLANALDPSSELITLILGEAHDPSTVEAFVATVSEAHPDLGFETVDGGQPVYPYLVSIE